MHTPELHIRTINQLYRFGWALEDFLVTDEQYTLRQLQRDFRVDGYVIGICLEGTIRVLVDGVPYEGGAHSMLIARPLQLLHFAGMSPDCRIRFILFSKRFLVASAISQHVLQGFQFSTPAALPVIRTSAQESTRIVAQFENIWSRFNDVAHPFRKELVGNLLLVLLYDFEAIYRNHFQVAPGSKGRATDLARRFSDLAQRHFRQEHAVEFYSRRLHLSAKYLSAAIREATGRTAGAVISELLLIEAQALLRSPGQSVKEVAHTLGFPDQSTFGKFFKRTLGLTPSEFIRQNEGNG